MWNAINLQSKSRIWTCIAVSISYDDNHYTMSSCTLYHYRDSYVLNHIVPYFTQNEDSNLKKKAKKKIKD